MNIEDPHDHLDTLGVSIPVVNSKGIKVGHQHATCPHGNTTHCFECCEVIDKIKLQLSLGDEDLFEALQKLVE